MQYVAVCCSVLQCVAVCYSVLQSIAVIFKLLQCVATYCSVLHCVAVCFMVLQCSAVLCCRCVVVCYSLLQRVAVHCSHILSHESTDSKPDYPVCTHPATHCNTLQLIAPPPFSIPSSLPPPPPPSLSSTPLSFFCVFTGYNLRFTVFHSNLIGQFASCDKMGKSRVQLFCGQSYQKSQVYLEQEIWSFLDFAGSKSQKLRKTK